MNSKSSQWKVNDFIAFGYSLCLYVYSIWQLTNKYLYILFQEWTSQDEEDKEANVWEDNWDDDNVEDDFSVQLR